MAYGQTASGKTHTILGPEEDPGIIPRSLDHIFSKVQNNDYAEAQVKLSYFEVYNETVFDLFEENSSQLSVRGSSQAGFYVQGLSEQAITSSHEGLGLLLQAQKNRSVSATEMNKESSRSHTLLKCTLALKQTVESVQTRSTLYIIDLAGSENAAQTGATGQTLVEGKMINQSLLALSRVMKEVADRSPIISWRDSVLTKLLNGHLGGDTKTVIICTINPDFEQHRTSLFSLQFADTARKVKVEATVHYAKSDKELIQELKSRVYFLERQLQQNPLQMAAKMGGPLDGGKLPPRGRNSVAAISRPTKRSSIAIDDMDADFWFRNEKQGRGGRLTTRKDSLDDDLLFGGQEKTGNDWEAERRRLQDEIEAAKRAVVEKEAQLQAELQSQKDAFEAQLREQQQLQASTEKELVLLQWVSQQGQTPHHEANEGMMKDEEKDTLTFDRFWMVQEDLVSNLVRVQMENDRIHSQTINEAYILRQQLTESESGQDALRQLVVQSQNQQTEDKQVFAASLEEARQSVEALVAQNAQSHAALEERESHIQSLLAEKDELQAEFDEVLKQRVNERVQMQIVQTQLQTQMDNFEQQVSGLLEEQQQTQNQLAALRDQIEKQAIQHQQTLSNAQAQISIQQSEIQQLTDSLHQAESEKKAKIEEMAALREQYSSIASQLEAGGQFIPLDIRKELHRTQKELETKTRTLLRDKTALLDKISKREVEHQQLINENNELKQIVTNLAQRVSQKENIPIYPLSSDNFSHSFLNKPT
ncbi:putative Centromere-associated protein E [Blattamonas nauphoetae]|uniref:Kinesin-like protein n=1 Tax=Blattamonas nauphoetae TaxID=2049346 RepID=A0ABQ9Y042_9EUKA|nr:putative Centromere-associated protein E [Blattamonas nauphoetae]